MGFQFEPYQSGLTGTIAELMAAPARARAQALRVAGDANARAAEIHGQSTAALMGSLSQIAGGVGQQISQHYADAPKREAEALQLKAIREDDAGRQNEMRISAGLHQLFNGEEPPTSDAIMALAGPERGMKIVQGLAALQADTQKQYGSTQTVVRDVMAGMDALPEDMRANLYPHVRQNLISRGVITEQDAPPDYDAAWFRAARDYGKQSVKPAEGFTLNPGETRFGPDGQQIATVAPKAPVEKPPALGSFEDYVTRYAKDRKLAPEQLSPKDIENARKAYQQSDDRPRITVNAPKAESLDTDGLDLMATQYRLLGANAIPARISGDDRTRVVNAAAAQIKAIGQSPAASIQKQAAYKADGASLTQMTKMKSSAEAFETKARAQAEKVVELSNKVGRSALPMINGAILAGKTEIAGNSDATQLLNAVQTFTAEYAKIIEGSTGSVAGSSDSARRMTERLLNPKMNKGTVADVVKLMQWEMGQTIQGYDATIDHISQRMGGSGQAGTVPPPAPGSTKIGRFQVEVH